MRVRTLLVCVLLGGVGSLGSSVQGQLVPPAPAKTPPSPEYTPPPPPQPPPQIKSPPPNGAPETKPVPEAPLPTLIEKDEKGKIKPLSMPTEEAAVRALKLNEETMQKVEASLAARREDLDRLVADNIETIVELKQFGAKVDAKTSIEELGLQGKKAIPFKNFGAVAERLARDGAIDLQAKSRTVQVAKEYDGALDKESYGALEHSNIQEMALLGFRRHIRVNMTEAFNSVDRQLAAAAPKMEELFNKLDMKGDVKSQVMSRLRGLPKAGSAGADAKRLEALQGIFFEVLGPEERGPFLRAANPKLGEPKKPDAAPTPPAAPPAGTPATPPKK